MKPASVFLLALISTSLAPPAASGAEKRDFDGRTLSLEEVFFDPFDGGLGEWAVEGDARVEVRDGFLEVDATGGEIGAATIWCRQTFAGQQVVEYDVRLMGNSLQSNVNMFLMAGTPAEPGSIGGGRYSEYHAFPNYLVTILNDTGPDKRRMLRLRLRFNPGFKLAAERWFEPLRFGQVYHVAYVIKPPELTVYLDGRRLAGHKYATRLDEGRHALRVWRTHSVYDNFRVSRIVE